MAASIQFHVGSRCYFTIDGKKMNGEIGTLNVSPGVHSVSSSIALCVCSGVILILFCRFV